MFIQLHPSCRLFKEKNRGVAHSSDVSECASCDVDKGWSDEEGEDHNVEAKHHNRFYKAHMFWNGGVDKYVIHVFQHVQEELESTFFTEEERTNRIVRWISELCVVSAVFCPYLNESYPSSCTCPWPPSMLLKEVLHVFRLDCRRC